MYEFLDRLVSIALPRVRDFRGITGKGFDGHGNYAMGLKEQIVFPEIDYDRVDAGPRHGHHVRDHGEDGRRSEGPAEGFRYSLRQLRTWKTAGSRAGQVPEDQTGWPRLPRSTATAKRERMAKRDKAKRAKLKASLMDRTLPVEDRFDATLKLAQLPRNGAAVRVRLRCELTGRARGNYRKFKLSPHRAARSGQCRADPRHGQGKLVRGTDMSMSDPVGDMLTRIRNAQRARHSSLRGTGVASCGPMCSMC